MHRDASRTINELLAARLFARGEHIFCAAGSQDAPASKHLRPGPL
jgi:hypothetical protein